MNTLIISTITFAIIISIVLLLLIKTKNLKKYNVFIYVSLFIFWFVMQIFKTNTSNMNEVQNLINNKPWIWPIIISLYQFTQVIVRIPIGMLCAKFKSRKLGVQLVTIVFIIAGITLVGSNFALWSVILTTIAAGFVGATFGLNSQYWSENWDIKKVFKSSVIMFTIPLSTASLANIFNQSVKHGDISMDTMRWIILASLIFGALYMILYSVTKERKETIGLDLGAPAEVAQTSSGYLMVWKLTFSACLMAFMNNLLINSKLMLKMGIKGEDASNLMSLIAIVSIVAAILTGTFLVKNFSIPLIKYASFTIVLIGVLIGLGLSVSHTYSPMVWVITSLLIVTGAVVFQVTLFGATLHLDHKHPALVLGIFLTARSFSNGTGRLLSDELLINVNSSDVASYIIFAVASLLSIVGLVFFIINHVKMNRLYKTLQEYEFHFTK